jgi:hypothetical protein
MRGSIELVLGSRHGGWSLTVRKLLLFLVVIGLLIAGDLWLKATAEKRVATELQSSFDADGEAQVEFSGFPFMLRLLSGTIPSTRVRSTSLERGGLRLRDVRLTLQDVSFSWSKVLSGEIGSVEVRDGHGRASIPVPDLAKGFRSDGDLEVIVRDGRLIARLGSREAAARLTLDGTDLVLRVPGLGRSFSAPLPRFVEGLQYRSVRIDQQDVVVEFSLSDANFRQI